MAIRCIRCGETVEGYSQLCNSCATAKQESAAASFQAAVEATTMACPSCSQSIPRSADACPNCGHDFTVKIRDWSFMANIGFGERFIAWFVDSILIGIIFSIAVAFTSNPWIAIALSTGVGLTYNVYFLTNGGQTPGKKLMRIRVMTMEHEDIEPIAAAVRYLVSSWLFIISQAFIIFSEDKRALHDLCAGTIVCQADYREKLAEYRAHDATRRQQSAGVGAPS